MESALLPALPILLVDDEELTLQSMDIILRLCGMNNIIKCNDSRDLFSLLSKQEIGLILLDLSMPYLSGEELLSMINQQYPHIPVIIITGTNEVETAVRCMKTGASDYMVKPVERNCFMSAIQRALEICELRRENLQLKEYILSDKFEYHEAFSEIITNNTKMQSIFQYVKAIADSFKPVLITGETGVGKELIARAIHTLSKRKGNYVPVNAAGLDDTVFSDNLFGHKKGAFTGADQERQGLIEKAQGGTLFLDEIGQLGHASQLKLLRLLQEHEYYPLGSDLAKFSDARIIVATNEDLQEFQKSGKFRKDLYYRVYTHHIHVPPLRERLDDLPLLVEHFLEEASRSLGKKKPTPPEELFILLSIYHFPGNVRELESMVYDVVSLHKSGKLSMEIFKNYMGKEIGSLKKKSKKWVYEGDSRVSFTEKLPTIKSVTEQLIQEALKRSQGKQSIASQILGISQQALSERLKRAKVKNTAR